MKKENPNSKIRKGKIICFINFIVFSILACFFAIMGIVIILGLRPHAGLLEYLIPIIIILFNIVMFILHVKAYRWAINNNWLKTSFVFKIISLVIPAIIFIIFLYQFKRFGPIEFGGLIFAFYSVTLSGIIYITSMIFFLIGYIKNKIMIKKRKDE